MTTGVSFKAVKKPTSNEAVQFCLEIWRETYQSRKEKGESEYFASKAAHDAYREAMPDLTSLQDVQDFIACVSRAILVEAIDHEEAAKLLAAAKIASQTFALAQKAELEAVSQLPPADAA
jgi:small ligand-binding sensory domain FIST